MWNSLPVNNPLGSRSPSTVINEEGKVRSREVSAASKSCLISLVSNETISNPLEHPTHNFVLRKLIETGSELNETSLVSLENFLFCLFWFTGSIGSKILIKLDDDFAAQTSIRPAQTPVL
ncbi:hypothetical protein OGAPHI_004892 [Ogataea philodendri]|uniref:Uncharacterized protein n=1 Tax=Ogataea philodendri TaxID=1378263 RepID=A0A9P8P1P7_9ASCO|nr:uncharacterized protein OGAPHI_004892 [Ogataea philodendri]KAH3664178.1 hypothetical protein OGAPHI_004892 [Ogataea philodendri]